MTRQHGRIRTSHALIGGGILVLLFGGGIQMPRLNGNGGPSSWNWVPGQGLNVATDHGTFVFHPGAFVYLLFAYVIWTHVRPIVRQAMAGEGKAGRYAMWGVNAVVLFILWTVLKPVILAYTGIG